jgi:site-specific DNA-methyltransferase (cytosine-N4-specific)
MGRAHATEEGLSEMQAIPSQRQLVLPLLDAVSKAGGTTTTSAVREAIADGLGLDEEARSRRVTVGGQDHGALGHRVRWAQQHARLAGLLVRGDDGWSITPEGRSHLTRQMPGAPVTIFMTPQGAAVWGLAEDLSSVVDHGSVRLLLTSPPYALNTKKAYGNESGQEYVDWLCRIVESLMPIMAEDGSLVFNLGDAWVKGSPTVSLYQERAAIALQDRLGLHLCQRLLWHNPSAMPVPSNWVGVERVRVKNAVETLWWMSRSERPYADNRNILEPYSDRMKALIASGGSTRAKRPSGHAQREGSFSVDNGGSIASNLFRIANTGDQRYAKACRDAGLPVHPARMPAELARKAISFLSRPDDLVVDPFGGSGTTARAAEDLGRRWVTTEANREYVEGARLRFAA